MMSQGKFNARLNACDDRLNEIEATFCNQLAERNAASDRADKRAGYILLLFVVNVLLWLAFAS